MAALGLASDASDRGDDGAVVDEVISSAARAAVMLPSNVTETWRKISRRVDGADGAVSSPTLVLSKGWMDILE